MRVNQSKIFKSERSVVALPKTCANEVGVHLQHVDNLQASCNLILKDAKANTVGGENKMGHFASKNQSVHIR